MGGRSDVCTLQVFAREMRRYFFHRRFVAVCFLSGLRCTFLPSCEQSLERGYFRNRAALLISCFLGDAISERKKGVKQQLTITRAAFNKLPAKPDIGVYVIRAGLLFVIGLSFSEHYRGIRELTKTQRGINWTAPNN